MTTKQIEMLYKWASPLYLEDEIECFEMLDFMTMIVKMSARSSEPMTEADVAEIEEWAWECNSNNLEAESRDQLFRLMLHEMIDTVSPYKIEKMIDLVEKSDEDIEREIFQTSKQTSYPTEPEAIYTGGGFWISCSWISDHEYAAISNEDEIPELAVYDNDGEDGYECNNMIAEILLPDMTESDLKLYQKLYTALQKAIREDCEIRH